MGLSSKWLLAGATSLLLVAATVFALTSASAEGFVADAGGDRTLECSSPDGAVVPLDATRSRPDENDTIGSYTWLEGYNTTHERVLGHGARLNVTLPLGEHRVTLRVANATGNRTAWSNATIRVVDTTPPVLTATPSVTSLWPPNHKTTPLHILVTAADACTANVSYVLQNATSNEADDGLGDGHTTADLQGVALGTPDTDFTLRAERAGPGTGREYAFTYSAVDGSGNAATATAVVTVPHDHGA